MFTHKIVSADEAVAVIRDGDTVCTSGFVGIGTPDELILPHPRAAERAFVLKPWAEVDPTAELPGAGAIADLLDELDTSGIVRVGHVH